MATIEGPAEVVAVIGTAAGRIRRFAEAVQQGHEFGIGPGWHDSALTLRFHREAAPIYARALPWEYLLTLSMRFTSCADLMVSVAAPASIGDEWSKMQQYLRSASTAMNEAAPGGIDFDQCATAVDIAPHTPAVMPFAALAELASAAAMRELRDLGAIVERAADQLDSSPLTDQETQWLRSIAAGRRTIDIANESGYSERSLYRALSNMWNRLGVDNRNEAIRVATERGWL